MRSTADPPPQRRFELEEPLGGGHRRPADELVDVELVVGRLGGVAVEPSAAGLQRPQAFWSDSGKVRPMAMTSPDRLHLGARGRAGTPVNFSKANRGTLVTT